MGIPNVLDYLLGLLYKIIFEDKTILKMEHFHYLPLMV